MDLNSSAYNQATAVNKCDYCNSAVRVNWMCVDCDQIICELCKNNHKKNHKILRIHGALELVVSEDAEVDKQPRGTQSANGKMIRTGGRTRLKTKNKTPGSAFVKKQPKDGPLEKGKVGHFAKQAENAFQNNGLNFQVTNSIREKKENDVEISKDNRHSPEQNSNESNDKSTLQTIAKINSLDLDMVYENNESEKGNESNSLTSLKDRKRTIKNPSPSVSPIKIIQNDLHASDHGPGTLTSNSTGSNGATKLSFVGKRSLPRKPFEGHRIHQNDTTKLTVKIISSDATSLRWINSLCSISHSEAWFGDVNPNILFQVIINDNKLQVIQSLEYKVTDIVAEQAGGILLSYEEGKRIQHIDSDGQVIKTFNTDPLCPQGLFMTKSGDFWVCLAEKVHAHKFPKCQVKLEKMTINGDTKEILEFDQRGKKLFSYPHSIIENINGDLCVIDMQIREKVQLMVFCSKRKIKFVYDGKERTYAGKPCDFGMVRNDSEGRLLLSDYVYHRIHMLTQDGDFIQFLLTESDGIYYPFAMAVDITGIVWIDCKVTRDKSAYSNIVRVQYQ